MLEPGLSVGDGQLARVFSHSMAQFPIDVHYTLVVSLKLIFVTWMMFIWPATNCINTTTNLAAVDIARIPGYEATQVFIPGHVVLLVTGPGNVEESSTTPMDVEGPQVNRVILRGMGFADDWICCRS